MRKILMIKEGRKHGGRRQVVYLPEDDREILLVAQEEVNKQLAAFFLEENDIDLDSMSEEALENLIELTIKSHGMTLSEIVRRGAIAYYRQTVERVDELCTYREKLAKGIIDQEGNDIFELDGVENERNDEQWNSNLHH